MRHACTYIHTKQSRLLFSPAQLSHTFHALLLRCFEARSNHAIALNAISPQRSINLPIDRPACIISIQRKQIRYVTRRYCDSMCARSRKQQVLSHVCKLFHGSSIKRERLADETRSMLEIFFFFFTFFQKFTSCVNWKKKVYISQIGLFTFEKKR